ncbi:hypothetical protein RM51_18005 [Chryseobacterium taiwanense]|uniref:Uncharacterized protein n=1 Tax=Chryseobacterium taiwanense TaxID=363331 RepID=A0A0B4DA76_9FLAO|nr:hypothetical protein RM51_18005 [Chryseobacterium taiwanense]
MEDFNLFNAKFLFCGITLFSEQRRINRVDLMKLYFHASRSKFYLPLPSKNKTDEKKSFALFHIKNKENRLKN